MVTHLDNDFWSSLNEYSDVSIRQHNNCSGSLSFWVKWNVKLEEVRIFSVRNKFLTVNTTADQIVYQTAFSHISNCNFAHLMGQWVFFLFNVRAWIIKYALSYNVMWWVGSNCCKSIALNYIVIEIKLLNSHLILCKGASLVCANFICSTHSLWGTEASNQITKISHFWYGES